MGYILCGGICFVIGLVIGMRKLGPWYAFYRLGAWEYRQRRDRSGL